MSVLTTVPHEGSGAVAAAGLIDGSGAVAFASDPRVQGGAMGTEGCAVLVAAYDEAIARGVPIIGLWHSGGARLAEGVASLDGVGTVFAAMTAASGVVPQISVVLGPAAGGAAYGPALTDIVILSSAGRIFVTGPDVVRSVTGEDVDMIRLGGPEVHSRRSGVVHLVAADDAEALGYARSLVTLLSEQGKFSVEAVAGRDLTGVLPDSARRAYDVHAVTSALLDDKGIELHPRWAPNIVTILGRLGGRTVGVIANNPMRLGGCLDSASAEKAARFVRFCDAFGVPLVVLVDVPGYLPGVGQEWDGVVRRGAKLLHAFAEATVARITLVTRKSYGGAYIAMNSKSLGRDQGVRLAGGRDRRHGRGRRRPGAAQAEARHRPGRPAARGRGRARGRARGHHRRPRPRGRDRRRRRDHLSGRHRHHSRHGVRRRPQPARPAQEHPALGVQAGVGAGAALHASCCYLARRRDGDEDDGSLLYTRVYTTIHASVRPRGVQGHFLLLSRGTAWTRQRPASGEAGRWCALVGVREGWWGYLALGGLGMPSLPAAGPVGGSSEAGVAGAPRGRGLPRGRPPAAAAAAERDSAISSSRRGPCRRRNVRWARARSRIAISSCEAVSSVGVPLPAVEARRGGRPGGGRGGGRRGGQGGERRAERLGQRHVVGERLLQGGRDLVGLAAEGDEARLVGDRAVPRDPVDLVVVRPRADLGHHDLHLVRLHRLGEAGAELLGVPVREAAGGDVAPVERVAGEVGVGDAGLAQHLVLVVPADGGERDPVVDLADLVQHGRRVRRRHQDAARRTAAPPSCGFARRPCARSRTCHASAVQATRKTA